MPVKRSLLLFGLVASVCSAATPAFAQRYLAGPDTLHPRIRYADSLDSVNDRCIISKSKLSRRIRPVYVNKKPIGFC
jgi:hypothetical protein